MYSSDKGKSLKWYLWFVFFLTGSCFLGSLHPALAREEIKINPVGEGYDLEVKVNNQPVLNKLGLAIISPSGYKKGLVEKIVYSEPELFRLKYKISFQDMDYAAVDTIVISKGDGIELIYNIFVENNFTMQELSLRCTLPEIGAWYINKGRWLGREDDPPEGWSIDQWGNGDYIYGNLLPATMHSVANFPWFALTLPDGNGVKMSQMPKWHKFSLGESKFSAELVDNIDLEKGETLKYTFIIEPLNIDELITTISDLGKHMLYHRAEVERLSPQENRLSIELTNPLPRERVIKLGYKITDYILKPIKEENIQTTLPPCSRITKKIEFISTPDSDYRLFLDFLDEENKLYKQAVHSYKFEVTQGPRKQISLDGTWEYMVLKNTTDFIYPPPSATWQKASVPGNWGPDVTGRPARLYFRRKFSVPEEITGTRLKLRFDKVNYSCKLYLNGKIITEHFGVSTPFTVDITDLVKAGGNELTLISTDDSIIKREDGQWVLLPSWWMNSGGINGSVWLLSYPRVYVSDTFIVTSFRRKEIKLQVSVKNEDNIKRKVELANRVIDKDGLAKIFSQKEVALKPGEETVVEWTEKWDNPALWWPRAPHLYNLVTEISEENSKIDLSKTRFGFREVWTEGKNIILNGVKINPIITAWHSTGNEWTQYWKDFSYIHALIAKENNIAAFRLHGPPPHPATLEACDELGLLCIRQGESPPYTPWTERDNKQFWENWRRHLNHLVLEDRNHPAIIIWAVENESLDEYNEAVKGGQMADLIRALDPTRPIMFEGDGDPDNKADIINFHYPKGEPDIVPDYLWPDEAYWLDKTPVAIQSMGPAYEKWEWKDKPLYIGEMAASMGMTPEYGAFWLGDNSYPIYAYEPRAGVSQAQGYHFRGLFEAYRYYGVSAALSGWTRDWLTLGGLREEQLAPLTVHFREWAHNFYSGQKVVRTLHVYNGLMEPEPVNLRIEWELKKGVNKIAGDKVDLFLQPGEMKICPVVFTVPRVKKREEVIFGVALFKDNKSCFQTQRNYSFFPELSLHQPERQLLVYDTVGKTAGVLDKLNLRHQRISTFDNLEPGQMLIIGEDSLDTNILKNREELTQWVKQGGRIICLQQEKYLSWLPVEITADSIHSSTMTFTRYPGHPLLADITDDDLKFWHKDHIVSRHNFSKPVSGNYRIIIDTASTKGLVYSPLIELPLGEGYYLLTQLDLIEKIDTEPAAGLVFANLLTYADTERPRKPIKVALLADKEGSLRATLDKIGLRYKSVVGKLYRTDLSDFGLLMVGGSESVWQELAENKEKVTKYVMTGGKVWLHDLGPTSAKLLRENFNLCINVMPGAAVFPRVDPLPGVRMTKELFVGQAFKITDDGIINGLSNTELYWPSTGVPVEGIQATSPTVRYVCSLEPDDGTKILTQPVVLCKISRGKGFYLIGQFLWDKEERARERAHRLASILLTNLGALIERGF